MEALPCNTIVFRTIAKKKIWGGDGQLASSFFMRRGPGADGSLRDEKGLSVNYDVDVPDGCARGFNNKRLIVSLLVGWIRDRQLDVIANSPTHANITGLPYLHEDEEAAEQFAAELREICRVVWSLADD